METRVYIENALQNGYRFKTSEYLSRGWKTFTENPGGYIGFAVLYFVISMFVGLIPIIGFLISLFINPPLSVGIPIAAHRQTNENNMEFGNFFKGFDHIGQLVITYLIQLVIYMVLAIPVVISIGFGFFALMSDPTNTEATEEFGRQLLAMWPVFLIVFLLAAYVGISMRWAFFLVVFHKYDAMDAIRTSWKLVGKNWFVHFGFILLMALVMMLGLIALLVGIVVAFPVVFAADYAAYADITGLNRENSEIDEIGGLRDMV